MPRWVVICPLCKRQHTYAEINSTQAETFRFEADATPPKPAIQEGEKQKCPACGREMPIRNCDLNYSYL